MEKNCGSLSSTYFYMYDSLNKSHNIPRPCISKLVYFFVLQILLMIQRIYFNLLNKPKLYESQQNSLHTPLLDQRRDK